MTTIPALPFSGQQLRDTLTALDGAIDGKEASGAAAAAVAAHEASADPHPQYTTPIEAAAAAPVQSVVLSVPSGWSGSSANVGGNVTLTLGLPIGSTLVGSGDRTSWDTAFTERNRWDGGATGLNASTGRTSLGLGNVDNTSDANKPVSTAAATALAGKANTGAIGSSGLTMATARLLGRSTAGSGAPEEITLGANLTLSGGILSASVTGGGGGTVSSVGLVAPTGFSVSGPPVTTSGNITLSFAAGYSLPTTASQGNWDTAFAERLYWDGGATGLNATTGRTSLGLGTLATANAATPPALGGTTPAAGAFTNLSASVELTLPSGAPTTPAARDVYAVADTLRYRDSGNAERLLLNAQDNLANLSNQATARSNLGLSALAAATVGANLTLSGGVLSATGGGGGVPSPGFGTFSSGFMLAPMACRAGLSNGAATLNAVVYYQLYLPTAQTLAQILCRTHTTYAGSTDVYMGIYDHNATTGRPNNKVFETGLVPITASGQANYAVAINVTLQAGWYWTAFLATALGTTPSFVSPSPNFGGLGNSGLVEITTAGLGTVGFQQTGQATLPATAGTLTLIGSGSTMRPVVFLGV